LSAFSGRWAAGWYVLVFSIGTGNAGGRPIVEFKMAQNWQADFEALNGRERAAFRWLEKTLHKLNNNPQPAVIEEMQTQLLNLH
jgi:hypothetical protein